MNIKRKQLAIIGGGAAGVASFIAAVRNHVADTIYIIDPKPIGPGIVFSTQDNDLICNTSIDTMSVIIDEPLDFLDYLLEQGYDVEAATFVPRKWMGRYLSNRFDKYCAIASQSKINIVHLPYLVHSLKIEGNGLYSLKYSDDQQEKSPLITDVIFCTGFGNVRIPDKLNSHQEHPTFIKSPYPEADMLKKIQSKSRVLIIGSKLSAIDAALLLCREGHHVTMISPSGQIPAVRTQFIRMTKSVFNKQDIASIGSLWNKQASKYNNQCLNYKYLRYFIKTLHTHTKVPCHSQFSSANDVYHRLSEEIEIAEKASCEWQDLASNFIVSMNELYLTEDAYFQGAFHPDFAKTLERYITAIALPNAKKLLHYINIGSLIVQPGEIQNISTEKHHNSWLIDWGVGEYHFEAVVNATGYYAPYFFINSQGNLEIDRQCTHMDDSISILSSMAAKIEQQENIWFVGMPAHIRLWTPNAMIAVTTLANRLIENISNQ